MARPTRTILFIATTEDRAQAASGAFMTAAGPLGLSWIVESRVITGPPDPAALIGTSVLVVVDEPAIAPLGWSGRVERLATSPDLIQSVNGLLARLLGGSDAPRPPKPPPPPPPKKVHTVKVSRETAGRRGKGVTVVSDLPLTEDQLKELATLLKSRCGTGGTAKDGRIEIQGDQRDRLTTELEKLGYKVKRAGG